MAEEPKQEPQEAQGDEEKDNRWGKATEFFFDNPTLFLTFSYLYATGTGILYSAALYGRFGINIFEYSELPDFLLAAFKDLYVLLYFDAPTEGTTGGLLSSPTRRCSKAKAAPKRRPSAAKRIIRAEVPKDTGPMTCSTRCNDDTARARTRRPHHQGRARTRQRGQGTPSRPCRHRGARGWRSASLRYRRDGQ